MNSYINCWLFAIPIVLLITFSMRVEDKFVQAGVLSESLLLTTCKYTVNRDLVIPSPLPQPLPDDVRVILLFFSALNFNMKCFLETNAVVVFLSTEYPH